MTLTRPKNPNYCATVVQLSQFIDLPNCDKVKHAVILGSKVVVDTSCQPGDIGLFFPLETALSREFCGKNNLFREFTFGNADPAKKGFFNATGRVKAVKFRGHVSEGFYAPLSYLDYLGGSGGEWNGLAVGDEFDMLGTHGICQKYTIYRSETSLLNKQNRARREDRIENMIVEGQFAFHDDTSQLKKNIHLIEPNTRIIISDKEHGTSGVIANVLVKRRLSRLERLARWFGIKVSEREYRTVYSSRKVMKGILGVTERKEAGYYKTSPWSVAANENPIPKGYTIYFELVGFTPSGGPIQKGYHYGAAPGKHKMSVYRVTHTDEDGCVHELGWVDMKAFCLRNNLQTVKELYVGTANDIMVKQDSDSLDMWQERLLNCLVMDYATEGMCPRNNNEVPAEGVVIRIEYPDGSIKTLKLKNFRFFERETKMLDAGEADMEEEEAISE